MLTTLPDLIASARKQLRCLDAETALTEMHATGGTLIDVREPVELQDTSSVDAVNIPRGILEMKVMDIIPQAEHPIYVHCATGGRATLAAEQLQRLGYNKVTVITCSADIVHKHQRALRPAQTDK